MIKTEKFISNFAKEFDEFFIKLLPKHKFSKKLHEAMSYSLSVGGTRRVNFVHE